MKLISKNSFLIIGSLIVVYYAYKWYDIEQKNGNLSFEPTVTLAAAVLTVLSYFLSGQSFKKGESTSNSSKVNQRHSGKGDNVAGDKIIHKK
jgi:hypothetical protein